jgi:hypothetical protein
MAADLEEIRTALAEAIAKAVDLQRENAILRVQLNDALAQLQESRSSLSNRWAKVKDDMKSTLKP